ncbi:uncharacterized protein FTOL_07547 [Fusarium torulosum]|uniref:DUF676 domain-containing protein n=1 Tax=Fusarium torulosum TaxID=33205 RepID=A0AAE8MDH9_9HYPO|nr:uncharacterized protein FTOL_07547 [Fusarium torulosum]
MWTRSISASESSRARCSTFSESRYGVVQLYPSAEKPFPEEKQLVLDVVLVHGLNGHAQRSFTDSKTQIYWPRDLLPSQVPNARVLTFGYNANSEKSSIGKDIFDISLQLINNLKDFRREENEKSRDVLFICHSLGGIIVKKAILLHLADEPARAVQRSIVGVFFMGTPHSGSSIAGFGSVIAKITSSFIDAPRSLIRLLKTDSSTLYDISRDFVNAVSDLKIRLVSFYELEPSSLPVFSKRVIVEKKSAIIGLPGEEVLGVHGRHGNICKFASTEDPKYRPVWIRVERFSKEAEAKLLRRESPIKEPKLADLLEPGLKKLGTCDTEDPTTQSIGSNTVRSASVQSLNLHWMVPFLPCASFTGRKLQLKQIHDYFINFSSDRQRWYAIYGLGGSGKTQLALTYALQNRSSYKGVFVLNADTEVSLQESFEQIHDRLSLAFSKDKVGAVKGHFDDENCVEWLLIFDNADNLESFHLTDYFPLGRNVHVIITSRDHKASELSPAGVLLEMMDPEDALDLLLFRSGVLNPSEQTVEDLQSIAKQLSYLPLAIDQASAYMRCRQCSPPAYLQRLKTERDMVLKYTPKLSSYKRSVIIAWEVSFRRLELEASAASKLLLLFSYLDYTRISEELLLGIAKPVSKMKSDGNPTMVTAQENGIDLDLLALMENLNAYEEAIERLKEFSLVRDHVETAGPRHIRVFSLHPLVAYCTQNRATTALKQTFAKQAINFVSHAFPEWSTNFRQVVLEFGKLTRSHLFQCLSYIDKPEIFDSNLEEHARKLLLVIWSIRTVQLTTMKPTKTSLDKKILEMAFGLAKRHGDPYIEAVAIFIYYRQLRSKKMTEEIFEDYIKAYKERSNDGNDGGRVNAAIGDMIVFRGTLRRDLGRDDDPSILLHAWSPLNPDAPSVLERNVKWFRDRTVGSHYRALGRFQEAEDILVHHYLRGVCILRDDLYPIRVDNVNRIVVLDERNKVRAEITEMLSRENNTEVAKIAWLSKRDVPKVYGSMVVYLKKRLEARRFIDEGFFVAGGESGTTKVFERRDRPK